MDPNKMHERVLEIQKNISVATPEQQTAMLGELLELASKAEQALSDIKIDIDEEQYNRRNINHYRFNNVSSYAVWIATTNTMEPTYA